MIEKFNFTMANLDSQRTKKTRIRTTINFGISSGTATEVTAAAETEASEEEEDVYKTTIFDKMMKTVTENRKAKTGRIEFTTDRIVRRTCKMEMQMKETMKIRRNRISP